MVMSISIPLGTEYVNKSARTARYELRFKYNTNADYFYFDLFLIDGTEVSLHNKVVAGYDFGGFNFVSNNDYSNATADTIESFRLVADG
jgi:hypothetical protein